MNFEIVQLPNKVKMLVKLVHFYIIEPQRPIGDKQGQFIIQPKTKHKTGLIFMKSQNKQRQRSKLRIPVLDKHFEVE
jgi:hypothetical protein